MSRFLRSDAALTGKPHIHTALKGKVTHFFQILPEKPYLCPYVLPKPRFHGRRQKITTGRAGGKDA